MTRMWMINPKKLCRQHLLGEHKELHQLIGSLNKGKSVKGHIEKGQVEIHNIKKRHKELVKEMLRRGYKHASKLPKFKDYKAGKINIYENEKELVKRCKACKELAKKVRVSIRKPKLSDVKPLREAINDKEVIKQLSGYPYPCPLSRMEKDVRDGIKGWKTKKSYAFTIIADGKIVGSIVLEDPSKDKKTYTLGYFIGKKFWNKGITTKAIEQIIKFAFKELKLKKIKADNDEINPASGRVLEKAGFSFVKKLKKKRGNVLFWELANES